MYENFVNGMYSGIYNVCLEMGSDPLFVYSEIDR